MINKEIHDALSFLLNCSLKDKTMMTQKENFDIIFTYIKKLEQNNEQLNAVNRFYKSTISRLINNEELSTGQSNLVAGLLKRWNMKDREKEIKYLMYLKSQLIKENKKELKQLREELIQLNKSKTLSKRGVKKC